MNTTDKSAKSGIALLLLLFGLTTMAVHAQKFKVGDLYYEVLAGTNEVKVTSQNDNSPYLTFPPL